MLAWERRHVTRYPFFFFFFPVPRSPFPLPRSPLPLLLLLFLPRSPFPVPCYPFPILRSYVLPVFIRIFPVHTDSNKDYCSPVLCLLGKDVPRYPFFFFFPVSRSRSPFHVPRYPFFFFFFPVPRFLFPLSCYPFRSNVLPVFIRIFPVHTDSNKDYCSPVLCLLGKDVTRYPFFFFFFFFPFPAPRSPSHVPRYPFFFFFFPVPRFPFPVPCYPFPILRSKVLPVFISIFPVHMFSTIAGFAAYFIV